jgi:uncharacterized membrane protein
MQIRSGRGWSRSISARFKHHWRFYVSLALGALVWVLTWSIQIPIHLAMAGNAFFGAYLVMMVGKVRHMTPLELRARSASADEGIILIVVITLAAIALSFQSIFSVLNAPGKLDTVHLALSLISVPLGWITLHTVMAFHYAHRFYTRHAVHHADDAGGLQFPGTEEPGLTDFLYYSFVVGMTAQVSDVQVLNADMRRVTLMHGVVSFFFNAVILALAVNVAVGSH